MKPRFKSILILSVTLAIGIAIGALSWSSVHNRRMEKLREMRNQGGLYSSVDRYIDPTDEDQEAAIKEVADKWQRQYGLIYRESGRKIEVAADSFRIELEVLLTDAQIEAIAPFFHRNRRSGGGNGNGNGDRKDDNQRSNRENDSQ